MMSQAKTTDLTKGNITPTLLRFAFPGGITLFKYRT